MAINIAGATPPAASLKGLEQAGKKDGAAGANKAGGVAEKKFTAETRPNLFKVATSNLLKAAAKHTIAALSGLAKGAIGIKSREDAPVTAVLPNSVARFANKVVIGAAKATYAFGAGVTTSTQAPIPDGGKMNETAYSFGQVVRAGGKGTANAVFHAAESLNSQKEGKEKA